MNFLSIIGEHLKGSGLLEAWVEAGKLGACSAEKAMAGKAYNKAIRAHKLAYQALWQIVLAQVNKYVQQHAPEVHYQITEKQSDDVEVSNVITDKTARNVNFHYWWNYIEMINIFLMFTRAQRESL